MSRRGAFETFEVGPEDLGKVTVKLESISKKATVELNLADGGVTLEGFPNPVLKTYPAKKQKYYHTAREIAELGLASAMLDLNRDGVLTHREIADAFMSENVNVSSLIVCQCNRLQ